MKNPYPIGTAEWFAFRGPARVSAKPLVTCLDRAPIAGHGEVILYRHDLTPVPIQAPEQELLEIVDAELPAEVEDELQRLKDAILTAPPVGYLVPAPIAITPMKPRSEFQRIFDRNRIAG